MKRDERTIKKIQELVPEIMKLKFGCKVNNGDIYLGEYSVSTGEQYFVFKRKEKGNKSLTYNIPANIDSFEILGRPISLEDVLLAIKRNNKALAIDSRGDFLTIKNSVDWYHNGFQWQLNKPFHEQSRKVKNFIGDLLLGEQ